MEFSRQEYWGGLPFPTPGDLPDPGIKPTFLASPALAGGLCTTRDPWEAHALCVCAKLLQLCLNVTLWTIAHQAPLSMGFSRQEYWGGLPFPTPGYLLDPGIEPMFLESPTLTGGFLHNSATWETPIPHEGEGEVTQSCPTLCDPVDCNLLGFSTHGILQARILEWIAISFSRGSSRPRDQT